MSYLLKVILNYALELEKSENLKTLIFLIHSNELLTDNQIKIMLTRFGLLF